MGSSQGNVFTIRADCDPASVDDHFAALTDRVASATPDRPLGLDLTEGRPSAVALQLAAAAALSLVRKGAFAGFGRTAAPILSATIDRQEAPA